MDKVNFLSKIDSITKDVQKAQQLAKDNVEQRTMRLSYLDEPLLSDEVIRQHLGDAYIKIADDLTKDSEDYEKSMDGISQLIESANKIFDNAPKSTTEPSYSSIVPINELDETIEPNEDVDVVETIEENVVDGVNVVDDVTDDMNELLPEEEDSFIMKYRYVIISGLMATLAILYLIYKFI